MMTTVTAVRERPILFSGDMVRAILNGSKTQTRRVVKPQPELVELHSEQGGEASWHWTMYTDSPDAKKRAAWPCDESPYWLHCPYGAPGDRLWVRETMRADDGGVWDYAAGGPTPDGVGLYRDQDDPVMPTAVDWVIARKRSVCPAIHMPRWASRLTLELTDVRVERLQEISEEDAIAEGCFDEREHDGSLPSHIFRQLWNSLNASRGYGWDVNPWVWVLSFTPNAVSGATPITNPEDAG